MRKFSLRYKFLMLTSSLLIMSVVVHLFMATQIFSEDKTALVFDLNKGLVASIENDVSHKIRTAFSQMGLLTLAKKGRLLDLSVEGDWLGGEDSGLIYAGLILPGGEIDEIQHSKAFLETYNIQLQDLTNWLKTRAVKDSDFSGQGRLVWRASPQGSVPVLGVARVVVEEDGRGRKLSQSYVVGLLSLEGLTKTFRSAPHSEVFILDSNLVELFRPKNNPLVLTPDLKGSLQSPVQSMVVSYQENDQKWLAAYSRGESVTVFSRTDSDTVFAVVRQLIKRSLLFGIMVICTAFILILIFSKTITRPLDSLISGMEKVSSGDLSLQIQIQSRDEIAILSRSFNQMIRDLKGSREELEEINRELEQKVADRTRRLEDQNRAVKEAQEALLRTTRLASVGEIAGRAAHEVLNPLTGILTRLERVQRRIQEGLKSEAQLLKQIREAWDTDYTEGGFEKLVSSWKTPSKIKPGTSLWEEDILNLKEVSEFMEKESNQLVSDTQFLLSEGQRINRIVGQMRSLSHIKREQRVESAHALLKESVRIMADLYDKEGAKIIEDLRAPSDLIYVNRDEFLQCMTNLLRNSLQAIQQVEMRRGQVVLRTSQRGDDFVIELEDNGVGVAPENQEKLFGSHFSTKSAEEGTGLGLSISRRFIRGFDGELALKSSVVGQGTVFEIRLPIAEAMPHKEFGT